MKTLFVVAVASLVVLRVSVADACSVALPPDPLTKVMVIGKDDLPKNIGIPLFVPAGTSTVADDELVVKQGDVVVPGAAAQIGGKWFWRATTMPLPIGALDVTTKEGDHASVTVKDRAISAEDPAVAIDVDPYVNAAPGSSQITCVEKSQGLGSCNFADGDTTTQIPTSYVVLPRITPTLTRPFASDDFFLTTTVTAFGKNADGTVSVPEKSFTGLDGSSTVVDRAYDEYCVTTVTALLGDDVVSSKTTCKPQTLDLTMDQAKTDGLVKASVSLCDSVTYPAGYTPPPGTTTRNTVDPEHGDPDVKSGSTSSTTPASKDDDGCNASGRGAPGSFALVGLALLAVRRKRARAR